MNENQKLKASLLRHEGAQNHLYDDKTGKTFDPEVPVLGHLTIGVGHNIQSRGLSDRAIDFILGEDVEVATADARRFATDSVFKNLSPARQNVLIEMSFQLGLPSLSTFRKLKAALLRHDYREVAREMLDSNWANNHRRRALALAVLMKEGDYDDV